MGERPEKFYGKSSEGFEKTKRLAAQLLELCQTAAPALPEDLKDACRELEQRYEESTFRVVVLGMFSRGKSTFLNALIGRRLLYESDREATGAITLLRNSPPLYRGGPFTGRDGLSEEQAQVIRQAMDQTGAVIFLVLPESLEAVGDAFYTRMLHPEGSPSQEELRRRSWFDAFRQVLARRLEQGEPRPAAGGHSEGCGRLHLPPVHPGGGLLPLRMPAAHRAATPVGQRRVKNHGGRCEQGLPEPDRTVLSVYETKYPGALRTLVLLRLRSAACLHREETVNANLKM